MGIYFFDGDCDKPAPLHLTAILIPNDVLYITAAIMADTYLERYTVQCSRQDAIIALSLVTRLPSHFYLIIYVEDTIYVNACLIS